MDTENFAIEYNGVRNACFFMFAALIADAAKQHAAEDRLRWLHELRDSTLGMLDAARQQNPAEEFNADTAKIAETARSVIGAAFALAEARTGTAE